MIFGRVAGTVVSTRKEDGVDGGRYHLIERCGPDGSGTKDYFVALDLVNSGAGDQVIVSQGSCCQWTPVTNNKPFDALVVGIVDLVDRRGDMIYRK